VPLGIRPNTPGRDKNARCRIETTAVAVYISSRGCTSVVAQRALPSAPITLLYGPRTPTGPGRWPCQRPPLPPGTGLSAGAGLRPALVSAAAILYVATLGYFFVTSNPALEQSNLPLTGFVASWLLASVTPLVEVESCSQDCSFVARGTTSGCKNGFSSAWENCHCCDGCLLGTDGCIYCSDDIFDSGAVLTREH